MGTRKKKTKSVIGKTDVVVVQYKEAKNGLMTLLEGLIADRDGVYPAWTGDAELDYVNLVRGIDNPPFTKGGEYIKRGGDYWGVLAGMLDLKYRPVKVKKSDISRRRRHILASAIEGLSQDQLLAYCVLIAYYLAPTFDDACQFMTELFDVWNLNSFEERFYYGLDCNLYHPIHGSDGEPGHVERMALVTGLVEIVDD